MLRIVDRYFLREVVASLLAVLSVLLIIFASKHFVRFMSSAAAGELPTYLILKALSLFTLSSLVMMLPFALFISIIITMGRMYKDSEVVAMEACGIGVPHLLRTSLLLGLVTAMLVAVLSLWIAPWAEDQQYAIRDQAKSESEWSVIDEGRFHEILDGRGIFYVEKMSDKGELQNIFVHIEGAQLDLFAAHSGELRQERSGGARYLVMEEGVRYEALADGGFRIHDYASSGIRIAAAEVVSRARPAIAQPTTELWRSDHLALVAEWHWRTAMPITCLMLSVLAVLLSKANPRQGRFGKLFIALLIYIAYVYLLMLCRSWIKGGVLPAAIGMWWVHGMAMAAVVGLWLKQYGWRWRGQLKQLQAARV